MISILIPVYNYDVTKLVYEIHKQALKAKIDFEIICIDDLSNDTIISINSVINNLKHTSYILSPINNGISITRQLLVKQSKYKWFLLVDADIELKDKMFISNYLNIIGSGYNFIFGGFDYKKIKPHKDYLLRWKYGKKCEALDAKTRNKTPYKVTIAANLLAKKANFNTFNFDFINKQYAMDYYFGALLKESNSKILHINNQVYHLGIEKSPKYLRKKEQAVETLIKLYKNNKIKIHDNDLLYMFINIKKTGLVYIFGFFFKLLHPFLKINLFSKHPKVLLLQFYKILYMCHFYIKTK